MRCEYKCDIQPYRGFNPHYNRCLFVAVKLGLLKAAAEKEKVTASLETVMKETMADLAVAHNK